MFACTGLAHGTPPASQASQAARPGATHRPIPVGVRVRVKQLYSMSIMNIKTAFLGDGLNSQFMPGKQARYWLLTIPYADYTPKFSDLINYIKGQVEVGVQQRGGTDKSGTCSVHLDRNGERSSNNARDNSVPVLECTGGINNEGVPRSSETSLVDGTNEKESGGIWRIPAPASVDELVANIRRCVQNLHNPLGYIHWQILAVFKKPANLARVKQIFGTKSHAEATKSAKASDYVWKDETSVRGTRFELGTMALKRNSAVDWESIRDLARTGELDEIDAGVYVRNYRTLKQIHVDHLKPAPIERSVQVYWGDTGTGKSRRAWDEASYDAYPKDPRSKFWDGYKSHENVVIDEFRGDIDVGHLLRWFDRYPVIVEIKGSSMVLNARRFWITSNLSPEDWYRGKMDPETMKALLRRLKIFHFTTNSDGSISVVETN